MSAWEGKGAQTAHPTHSLPAEELRPAGEGVKPFYWNLSAGTVGRCSSLDARSTLMADDVRY